MATEHNLFHIFLGPQSVRYQERDNIAEIPAEWETLDSLGDFQLVLYTSDWTSWSIPQDEEIPEDLREEIVERICDELDQKEIKFEIA